MFKPRAPFLLCILALSSVEPAIPQTRKLSDFDPDVKRLLAQMSLDEKLGQMTQADQMFLKSIDDIEKYHLGSLLSGGDSDPKPGNDLTSWTNLYDSFQTRALKTRLRIPLLYGIDAVHGHNNVLGATIFPHNIGLGATRNAALVEKIARITAQEVRATGVNWAFAPCVAAPQDIRWGRTYEGFSESPDLVKIFAEAATRGLQGKDLADPLSVLACAKHFAGDGGTTFGTGQPKADGSRFPLDQGDTRVPESVMRQLHLQGYPPAIAAGLGSIMPSYNSWNGVKASASKRLMTDILKDEFGFQGFLISDYAALNQLPGNYEQQIEQSINAGMDMVMVPEHYQEFFEKLKKNVEAGRIPMSRIDDAVTRILRVKFAMGLMDRKRSQMADRSLHSSFGSPEHRAVARDAVRQSLVVLKNDNGTLPIAKSVARIHVAGKSANDLGNQSGGWTITWQGKSGPVIEGTTVLAAIRKAVGAEHVTFSADGSGAAGAALGIAVVGETPYAEMFGDRTSLPLSGEDADAVSNLKNQGIPVVVVVISGRPIFLEEILAKSDAIVAAWLPGTEGDGVADVLFGAYKPSGKLSYTWPEAASKSLRRGDEGYRTLFPFGYGLTW